MPARSARSTRSAKPQTSRGGARGKSTATSSRGGRSSAKPRTPNKASVNRNTNNSRGRQQSSSNTNRTSTRTDNRGARSSGNFNGGNYRSTSHNQSNGDDQFFRLSGLWPTSKSYVWTALLNENKIDEIIEELQAIRDSSGKATLMMLENNFPDRHPDAPDFNLKLIETDDNQNSFDNSQGGGYDPNIEIVTGKLFSSIMSVALPLESRIA